MVELNCKMTCHGLVIIGCCFDFEHCESLTESCKSSAKLFFPWHPAGVYSPGPPGSIKEPNIVFYVPSKLIRLNLNPLLLAFDLTEPAPFIITSTFHS